MTKTKAVKEEPIHKDRVGQTLKVDDYVVYSQGNHLNVGIVKKLNNKMIGVARLIKNRWSSSYVNKYPEDCVIVDGARVTMLIMQQEEP